jgi:hypothetical protein
MFTTGAVMARARKTDPLTSHIAGEALNPAVLKAKQNDVYQTMLKYGPMPDFILQKLYKAEADSGKVAPQSESGVRSRRAELYYAGFVRWTLRYVETEHGHPAMVWEAVPCPPQ